MKTVLAASAILAFLTVPILAAAVGMSPARMELNFQPGFEQDYTFQVFNNDGKTLDIRLYASGDLAEYITLSQSNVTLAIGETKTFSFHVKLPQSLEPGKRDTRIGAVEMVPPGAAVAAVSGVEMQFWVYVPYPEKYIAVDIATINVPKPNRTMNFTVTLTNPVNASIDTTADFEIQDANNTTLDRFELGGAFLKKNEFKTFPVSWIVPAYGDYKAVARANYAGQTTRKEVRFGAAEPQTQQPQPQPAVQQPAQPDMWQSPYTYIIALLIIAIIAVALWPEKKRRSTYAE